MNIPVRTASAVLAVLAPGFVAPKALEAETPDRATAVRQQLDRFGAYFGRMPAKYRARLSGSARAMAHRSRLGPEATKPRVERDAGPEGSTIADAAFRKRADAAALGPIAPVPLTAGKVSDPTQDWLYSQLAGFTQNQSSTAWCGNSIVVAYNDSGSYNETFAGDLGLSYVGFSRSANKGTSFTDQGYVPAHLFFDTLLGGPAVGCTDANTFYLASPIDASDSAPNLSAAVSLSRSSDGGMSFGNPVVAVGKDPTLHFLDKAWMAAVPDPTNPSDHTKDILYVSYTDFDASGSVCSNLFRTGIEIVKSTDGGATWSAPVEVDRGCDPESNQGSQVVVDNAGNVYVAYEHFGAGSTGRQIRIRKSTNGGASFGSTIVVAAVEPAGAFLDDPDTGEPRQVFQGNVQINEYPSLAVDRSGGPRNGHLYLAWTDGSLEGPDDGAGSYNFADIRFSRSTDGVAWTTPKRVNSNVEPLTTPPSLADRGTDQFFPGVAVDKGGAVGVCYYDRSPDAFNWQVSRTCAKSTNGGDTFANAKKSAKAFLVTPNQDTLAPSSYWGDYDSLASDATRVNVGFKGAYQDTSAGNPDLKLNSN